MFESTLFVETQASQFNLLLLGPSRIEVEIELIARVFFGSIWKVPQKEDLINRTVRHAVLEETDRTFEIPLCMFFGPKAVDVCPSSTLVT